MTEDVIITSINQGWLLCFLSSLMCILGCLMITTDLIYQHLFPGLAKRYPFHIQENSSFLIASLSLSSGSLIFTSMFKLLPEGQDYYSKIKDLSANLSLAYLLGFYLLGILICGGLNILVHFFTSESIVHCVHGEDGHSHDEENELENHHHDEEDDANHQIQNHTLSNNNSATAIATTTTTTTVTQPSNTITGSAVFHFPSDTHSVHDSSVVQQLPDETTNLLERPVVPTRQSFIDMSLHKIKVALHKTANEHNVGKCHGYDSFEKCVLMSNFNHDLPEENDSSSDSSKKINADFQKKALNGELYYCELPTPENLLFFQQQFHSKQPNGQLAEFVIQSPLIRRNQPSGITSHNHQHDLDHENHKNKHHHHITTPLSRLLSIGLQTIMAITLHKFPEGLIMYSTSQLNPSLGLTIFLSLAIHNFVEGFTMCLPMYLALNSRWKLILLSGVVGGLAQPLGAVLGWLIFRGSDLKSTDSLNFLFGNLMALTSGFLTIIGFQMFASAMAFGGTQRFVLVWVCIGITIIGLSYILIGGADL